MKEERPLSTADLANVPSKNVPSTEVDRQDNDVDNDVRGHHEELIVGNQAVADRAASASRAVKPASARQSETRADPAAAKGDRSRSEGQSALFAEQEAGNWRRRWSDIQTGFVDEPRRAVEQADGLVAEVMKRLAEGFANERATLERQWDRGDNVTTEDLRITMQRYHAFFDRLLSV